MSTVVNLMALGLNTSPNQLNIQPGSMTEAKNIVIRRDSIIESRRGFKVYGDNLPISTDRAKQIFSYKQRILRHYRNKIQFDDGEGNFTDFAGEYSETEEGLRMKSIEANGNFFFTTSAGIKKISANTASQFSSSDGYIVQAGGIKALDGEAELNITLGQQNGFLPKESAVAYRILWGINDANSNLILGTPSSRIVVYNPLTPLMLRDFTRILGALDDINQTGSLITDGDYIVSLNLPSTATESQLRTNLIELVEKLDDDIVYADDSLVAPLALNTINITGSTLTINFSSGDATEYFDAGSKITLAGGFEDSANDPLDGDYVILTVLTNEITVATTGAAGAGSFDPTSIIKSNEYKSITQPDVPSPLSTYEELIDIQTYLANILLQLQEEPIGVISTILKETYIDPIDLTNSANVDLTIYIPEEVTENHFFQVYRSEIASASLGLNLLQDVVPSDELQLVYEAFPTTAELSSKIINITDIAPDEFRGVPLYTNSISGEGILQSNDLPPFATDINRFKNVLFYANTRTKYRKQLKLLGVQNILTDYNDGNNPRFIIATESNSNIYYFVKGVKELTEIETVAGSLLNNSGTASYFFLNTPNGQPDFYIWYEIGTATDPAVSGRTGIKIVADALDTADEIATKTVGQLGRYNQYFEVNAVADLIGIENITEGYCEDATAETSGFTVTIIENGQGENFKQEIHEIDTIADVGGSLTGLYFTINGANDQLQYYLWFRVSGGGFDPLVANRTSVPVDIETNDTADEVALAVSNKLNELGVFSSEVSSNTVTVTTLNYGASQNPTVGTSGFTITNIQEGALDVLLSTEVSPAVAVENTTLSLIRAINLNEGETNYAFYLSGALDNPGEFLIESQTLGDEQFYITSNTENVGASFSPNISGEINISSISTGNPSTMLVTTSSAHGLVNQDQVIIGGTDSVPVVDGVYTITYVSPTTFRIPITITSAATTGSVTKTSRSEYSENEAKGNRIYYSKIDQPEAVPILNYFDVGASDKKILRIFPLRDSLFVFKEDGVFRISGELAPFNLSLFDSSFELIAPDSVSVVNNAIYAWATEGINTLNESGAGIISRPIDDQILKFSSSRFSNFSMTTWGIGYDSDNAYLVFTNTKDTDTTATQCYRYNTLTNTWTSYDIGKTCGVLHVDDKLYLGATDINAIEQERKSFERTDYADREYQVEITTPNYFGTVIKFPTITNFEAGDVIVQNQKLTIYDYNMLLKKLDTDSGVSDNDYFSTLQAIGGQNLRNKLIELADKLDLDPGVNDTDYFNTIDNKTGNITLATVASPTVITSTAHGLKNGRNITITGSDTTPSINGSHTVTVIDANTFTIDVAVSSPGTTGSFVTNIQSFDDLQACFNAIVVKLNADLGVNFNNYQQINKTTAQEAVISSLNKVTKEITIGTELPFISGPLTLYKAIETSFTYSPITLGDPVNYKHLREATMMFINKAFTKATLSFATDLLPQLIPIPFNGDGNGIFGHIDGFGDNFFGGGSNSEPFRTYIPRQCQRCRYIVAKFTHRIAREQYGVYGLSITGKNTNSSRAYR